ncbi:glycosyltransferase [Candidatus Parcubacteria bacterium]|nr:glycosyltransferase [Candidatus Parcubacteria bacterium]
MQEYVSLYSDVKKDFLKTDSPKGFLTLNLILALIYFVILAFFFPVGNQILFWLLIAGELFHVWQVCTFIYTVWDTNYQAPRNESVALPVDVFITVAGEPAHLVEQTAVAAKNMDYPHLQVYILNDGYVAKKDNWREIESMASRVGVRCITRTIPGGAKAGNINNALRLTNSPLVAIFDADHVPHRDFLRKTAPYFVNRSVGFVQTPQFYKNFSENYLTRSSWEQQELFFGAICKGKNRLNAATMCGTNMLIARHALLEVGGMRTDSIAEDFVTGLLMHAQGYVSVYHGEVLAEGLATEDLLSYSKQQFRWARGALDVIFRYNPLFRSGLTLAQKIQYLSSASFYLSGFIVLIDALLPIIFFFTGAVAVQIEGMFLAAIFLPYMFVTIYAIQRSSNFTFTFPSLGFSIGAFNIHIKALWAAVTLQRSAFVVTEKQQQKGQFFGLVKWHIAYIVLAVVGMGVALTREGFSASFINNVAWAILNSVIFMPFIAAAFPSEEASEIKKPVKEKLTYGKVYR